MNPFVSHPSVRIKGTENNYEPVTCVEAVCKKAWPHMHCPFCVKSEVFQDPVILKAHYRVKHVDKGIEFAGLKILRCCERCDIIGTIKGTKEFKGAHWHCYRCRNGFTRRDEAVKHYRTHFRNPSTTFQIQVAQDINQSVEYQVRDDGCLETGQDVSVLETVVTTSNMEGLVTIQPSSPLEMANTEPMVIEKPPNGEIQVSVAANETVDTCDGQTFMIIHDESNLENGEMIATVERVPVSVTITPTPPPGTITEHSEQLIEPLTAPPVNKPAVHWRQDKAALEAEIRDVRAENASLITDKHCADLNWNTQVENLKVQLEMANSEIATYQKREMELLDQLKIPLDDRINELLSDLKTQHEELLHNQLAQLRRTYINQLQEEISDSQKSPSSHAQDVNLIVQSDTGDSLESTVMATVTGSNSMVLAGPPGYTTLSTSALNGGNIMLTSDGLITDSASTSSLFVMSHPISAIKPESGDTLVESDQTAMISNALLNVDDPSASLTSYSQVEVEPPGEQNIGDKILLSTAVVTDDSVTGNHGDMVTDSNVLPEGVSTDMGLPNQSAHMERISDEQLVSEVLSVSRKPLGGERIIIVSGKRKFLADPSSIPKTKQKIGL